MMKRLIFQCKFEAISPPQSCAIAKIKPIVIHYLGSSRHKIEKHPLRHLPHKLRQLRVIENLIQSQIHSCCGSNRLARFAIKSPGVTARGFPLDTHIQQRHKMHWSAYQSQQKRHHGRLC